MKLTFLGTCAADFSIKLQNELKNEFSKDIRRSSSAIIDDHILIDCGPHTLNSLDILNIPYNNIDAIVFTHLHSDHFDLNNVMKIALSRKDVLKIYVREDADFPIIPNTLIIKMKLFDSYDLIDGYIVTGLPTNHDEKSYPQWIYLTKNDKKYLYALDGGWVINSSYYYLYDKKLDLIIFDATVGNYNGDYRIAEHNSIPMVNLLVLSFKTANIIKDTTKLYISHMAQSLHESYDKTKEITSKFGVDVAYDGLTLENI